jgi:hypothetical protein
MSCHPTHRYATIKEEEGRCYLYLKTVERAHTPKNLWQKIKLKRNYAQVRPLCVCRRWRFGGVFAAFDGSGSCAAAAADRHGLRVLHAHLLHACACTRGQRDRSGRLAAAGCHTHAHTLTLTHQCHT